MDNDPATPAAPIDLAALDTARVADEGRELELVHPQTGEPVGIRITIRGTDSDAYRRALLAQQRVSMERLTRNRKQRKTPEELEDESIDVLATLTTGWAPFNLEGKPYPYSHANAVALYRRFRWIREQADAFAGDRANFLPR